MPFFAIIFVAFCAGLPLGALFAVRVWEKLHKQTMTWSMFWEAMKGRRL